MTIFFGQGPEAKAKEAELSSMRKALASGNAVHSFDELQKGDRPSDSDAVSGADSDVALVRGALQSLRKLAGRSGDKLTSKNISLHMAIGNLETLSKVVKAPGATLSKADQLDAAAAIELESVEAKVNEALDALLEVGVFNNAPLRQIVTNLRVAMTASLQISSKAAGSTTLRK